MIEFDRCVARLCKHNKNFKCTFKNKKYIATDIGCSAFSIDVSYEAGLTKERGQEIKRLRRKLTKLFWNTNDANVSAYDWMAVSVMYIQNALERLQKLEEQINILVETYRNLDYSIEKRIPKDFRISNIEGNIEQLQVKIDKLAEENHQIKMTVNAMFNELFGYLNQALFRD